MATKKQSPVWSVHRLLLLSLLEWILVARLLQPGRWRSVPQIATLKRARSINSSTSTNLYLHMITRNWQSRSTILSRGSLFFAWALVMIFSISRYSFRFRCMSKRNEQKNATENRSSSRERDLVEKRRLDAVLRVYDGEESGPRQWQKSTITCYCYSPINRTSFPRVS